jgi:hypothetical protein
MRSNALIDISVVTFPCAEVKRERGNFPIPVRPLAEPNGLFEVMENWSDGVQ